MNIELKHFQAFIAVAKHLHFASAAREIHVSDPTLSLWIHQLEDIIGAPLFSRSTRNVELTEMGKEFLPRADQAINAAYSAVDYIQDFIHLKRGKVTVAAFPSVATKLLPSLVSEFRNTNPNVTVSILDGIADFIVDWIQTGVADFAIASELKEQEDLEFIPIFEDSITLLLSKGHKLSHRKSVAWHEFIDESVVTVSTGTGIRQTIDETLSKHGLKLKAIIEPRMIHTVLALCEAGVGPGIVLSSYLRGAPPGLVAIKVRKPVIRHRIGIIKRASTVLTPAASALFSLTTERLSDTANHTFA
ncbi:MAG: LysR family transcriptional regulator [Gammaproteobacteria bacterium]|nr:LysR family transcriptional regulator [Gammaproteobacteria bacterium]MCY4218615.1 LysR family transcriptional regulator [Gammaproteobacteria bacterium]MCY4275500.1 LysR family transcriptional regulator [Gammaproteobacteria bacterium]